MDKSHKVQNGIQLCLLVPILKLWKDVIQCSAQAMDIVLGEHRFLGKRVGASFLDLESCS